MPRYIIIMSTAIDTPIDSNRISLAMTTFPGILEWSVDFEDSDKILRVVCNDHIGHELVESLGEVGLRATVLEVFDENGISLA